MYKEIWKKLRFSTNIISVYYKKTIIEVIGNNTIRYIAFAVPIDLSYTIFEIFNVEWWRALKFWVRVIQGNLKVAPVDRYARRPIVFVDVG